MLFSIANQPPPSFPRAWIPLLFFFCSYVIALYTAFPLEGTITSPSFTHAICFSFSHAVFAALQRHAWVLGLGMLCFLRRAQ